MKSLVRIPCVFLGCLLTVGCGNPTATDGSKQAETLRKVAAEAARAQYFKDLVGNGHRALGEKRFNDAIKHFEEAVRFQDDPQVRELLQQARKAQDEARRVAYDQAMVRGDQARKEKNYPAAVAAFREALGQLRDDKDAANALREAEFHDFLEQGRVALKNEKFADAVKTLGEAVNRQPEDNDSRDLLKQAQTQRRLQVMAQGQTAFVAKQYPEAVRFFTEAKDLLADAEVTDLLAEASFQAKMQLGRQRVEAHQFAAAIPDLEEAVRLRPDLAEPRDLLQKAKDGKKQGDKADYDRAVTTGDVAMLHQNYEAAINAYRDALTKQPQDGTASSKLTQAQNAKSMKDAYDRHMSQGKTQLTAKNYLSAQMEFRAALSDVPGDPEAQHLLQQAQNAKSKKDSYDRHMSQGKAHLTAKNYRLAETEFQAALADIPGDMQAQRLLQQARQGKR
jgi:tetratricopeptide (TPR) repeat protein